METETRQKILVATDFSEGSDEALTQAMAMAAPTRAAIELVHVIDLAEEFAYDSVHFDLAPGSLYTAIDRRLSERAERMQAAGLSCSTKVLEGNTVAEITQRARSIDADLIVVGTHGRTGLNRAMMGSVAERVVRRASCPVLTVPFSRKAA